MSVRSVLSLWAGFLDLSKSLLLEVLVIFVDNSWNSLYTLYLRPFPMISSTSDFPTPEPPLKLRIIAIIAARNIPSEIKLNIFLRDIFTQANFQTIPPMVILLSILKQLFYPLYCTRAYHDTILRQK